MHDRIEFSHSSKDNLSRIEGIILNSLHDKFYVALSNNLCKLLKDNQLADGTKRTARFPISTISGISEIIINFEFKIITSEATVKVLAIAVKA